MLQLRAIKGTYRLRTRAAQGYIFDPDHVIIDSDRDSNIFASGSTSQHVIYHIPLSRP